MSETIQVLGGEIPNPFHFSNHQRNAIIDKTHEEAVLLLEALCHIENFLRNPIDPCAVSVVERQFLYLYGWQDLEDWQHREGAYLIFAASRQHGPYRTRDLTFVCAHKAVWHCYEELVGRLLHLIDETLSAAEIEKWRFTRLEAAEKARAALDRGEWNGPPLSLAYKSIRQCWHEVQQQIPSDVTGLWTEVDFEYARVCASRNPNEPGLVNLASNERRAEVDLLILQPGLIAFRGHSTPLKGKPWEVLRVLLKAPGMTCTVDYIIKAVWDTQIITEDTVRSHISSARQALRDAIRASGVELDSDPIPCVDQGTGRLAWRLTLPSYHVKN